MDITLLFQAIWRNFSVVFLEPGSMFSLTSLFCALLVALLTLVFRRWKRGRAVRLRTLFRALMPARLFKHASSLADVGLFVMNAFLAGALFGWAILSYAVLSHAICDGLTAAFGARTPSMMPDIAARCIITLLVFLAYEFAYWLDHYLSHRVPFLWEFHKVHHTAEVLTPVTVWRVHPIDSIVYYNITAVITAMANGIGNYLFGRPVPEFGVSDINIILVVFIHLYLHLQHSHLWIAFRGFAGRIFLSPAHHQVHHSTNPIHFNKNLGGCLALWDWLFGTLHIPSRKPEKLHFGVEDEYGHAHHHTVTGLLLTPFVLGWRQLLKGLRWLENEPPPEEPPRVPQARSLPSTKAG